MGRRHYHCVAPKDILILLSDLCCGWWAEFRPEMTLAIERPWTLLAKLSSRGRARIFRNNIMAIPQMSACLQQIQGFQETFTSSGHFNRHKLFLWLFPRALQKHAHLSLMFFLFKLLPFQLPEWLYSDLNKSATESRQIIPRKAHLTHHPSPVFQGGLYELASLVLAEVSAGGVTT